MKQSKSKKKNLIKKESFKNLIFVFVIIIILILIIVLSLISNKKESKLFKSFNSSEFKNISVIGLAEYQASLIYDGVSVIFFCSNEEEECYNELKELDAIAKEYNLIIEYVNVLELVDSEKETLANTTSIFIDNYYPHLLLIKEGKILSDSNEYLNNDGIKKLLQKYEIIK